MLFGTLESISYGKLPRHTAGEAGAADRINAAKNTVSGGHFQGLIALTGLPLPSEEGYLTVNSPFKASTCERKGLGVTAGSVAFHPSQPHER